MVCLNLNQLSIFEMHCKSLYIVVDCTKAGNGDLEVTVKQNNNKVPSFVSKTSTPGLYNVHFTPYTSGVYKIAVSFSKAEIRGNTCHR